MARDSNRLKWYGELKAPPRHVIEPPVGPAGRAVSVGEHRVEQLSQAVASVLTHAISVAACPQDRLTVLALRPARGNSGPQARGRRDWPHGSQMTKAQRLDGLHHAAKDRPLRYGPMPLPKASEFNPCRVRRGWPGSVSVGLSGTGPDG